MKEKKNEKKIKIAITLVIVILLLWLLIINPLIQFKSKEKTLLNAAERYFEINQNKLPTGNKVRSISLKTLYDQDFITTDLKAPYSNKMCDEENSWVKVSKDGDEYKYHVYLECGIFHSNVDHKGPTIKLNGDDEITINKGEKYKELGVASVRDDTDGKMDIKNVEIDSSKVDTTTTGTYEVTYKIKDSFDNTTVKTRIIKVVETINHVVKTSTDDSNIYKGENQNNYIKLDGIIFKIVGINSDGSVKVVSEEPLASLDYTSVDTWLNEYFYEKLSDSAKKVIKEDSKWCTDAVKDATKYTGCKTYSKEKAVGLLSIADYNNAIDSNGTSNIINQKASWLSNKSSTKKAWVKSYYNMTEGGLFEYKAFSTSEVFNVRPALNIKKNTKIVSGDGSQSNPYILKGNTNKNKKGSKISDTKVGTYISYSGYTWRVIGKEKDNTTKVIMIDPISDDSGIYYTTYDNEIANYNPNSKTNIGYKIVNEVSKYVKTDYFVKKEISTFNYKDKIDYDDGSNEKNYKVKLSEISMFDMFSATSTTSNSVWYKETIKNKNNVYIYSPTVGVSKEEFSDIEAGVKLVGYLNENVVIKAGDGTSISPYTLTK